MRNVFGLVLLLATAACSLPQTRWEKPGADEKTTAGDLVTCRRAAQQEAMRDLPWPGPVPIGPRSFFYRDNIESDRFYMEHRLTDFCMRNKGYTLVTIPPAQTGPPSPEQPVGKS
ncbi:MAG TPA: hypothetical protein VMI56_27810 [Reyranella sp.]|nr:hypothetical protein [Reyranella sp.]